MADISKITLPSGVTYNIKDETARAAAAAGLTLQVATELPIASQSTMGIIYLIADSKTSEKNIYKEYVTVSKDGAYTWEMLGTNEIDLSGYSQLGHTHSVTSNVTVGNHTYTPAGTVSAPDITVTSKTESGTDTNVYSITGLGSYTASQWTSGSYTESSFTEGSYTESSYTPESYEVADEILTITASSYTKESVTMPTYTKESVTLPSYTAESVTLPTREKVVIAGSASVPTFSGTEASISHDVTNNAVTSGEPSK